MYRLLLTLLLPALLIASWRERVKQVDLVHNWTADPNNQAFLEGALLGPVRDVLQLKQTTLKVTDLRHEADSPHLSYVVQFNHCPWLKASQLQRFPLRKRILFMWEPPVVQPKLYQPEFLSLFKRVYTWDDSLVDNKKFFKFYYPELKPLLPNVPAFHQRKFLTQISGHKSSHHPQELYSERKKVIEFFEAKPEAGFEFYGFGWEKEGFQNYKGTVENKLETLKHYKFSICYENMRGVHGYVTEKIFDCFAAGTIPIYWGACNIDAFIPKECFIDRREFASTEELYAYLQTIDAAAYEKYLASIKQFLASDKAKLFSHETFHVLFLEAIRFP